MSARILEVRSRGGRNFDRPGLGLLAAWILIAWVVELVDQRTALNLDQYGIVPRDLVGLRGVLCSPWLHGSWQHLITNTVAFVGLGVITILVEGRRFIPTTIYLVLLSGMGTWIIARGGVHIGASGLIYGYFGYILGRAIWEGRVLWIVFGVVVAAIYGGMIGGVFPGEGGISWEGHLAGLVGGLWLGKSHARRRR
ncbi:MAG: rhomboid family intramembrane serine protease [Verrucomicrobiaceae bacterium]|nr:rhomboid family intramembrane serine protease [Verrucomicrobiaceae bacterium]